MEVMMRGGDGGVLCAFSWRLGFGVEQERKV